MVEVFVAVFRLVEDVAGHQKVIQMEPVEITDGLYAGQFHLDSQTSFAPAFFHLPAGLAVDRIRGPDFSFYIRYVQTIENLCDRVRFRNVNMIPSNILAVSVLKELKKLPVREDLEEKAAKLAGELEEGIDRYGIIRHPEYGEIFVYETDGLGNYRLMDDANLPSLLGTTLVPVKEKWKEVYRNTRRFLLSAENPYYYEGKFGKGIGSPHTPERYIWHIALCVQGMTSEDPEEQKEILETLKNTTAGTNLMHEGFDVDAPEHFTRDWFAWANSMFCLFVNSLLS